MNKKSIKVIPKKLAHASTQKPIAEKPSQSTSIPKTPAQPIEVSVARIPEPIRKMANTLNPLDPNNNAVGSLIQDNNKAQDNEKFNFDPKQFTEEEQDIITYIDNADIKNIEEYKFIIYNNKKILTYMFIKANEYRGTINNRNGIQMLEILLENEPNDYVLLITAGLSYFENNEFYKAKETLENALLRINKYSHKNVVEQVRQTLSLINDSIANIKGDFSLGYGYDDNPSYLSSSNIITIFNLQLQNAKIHSDLAANIMGTLNYSAFFNDNIGSSGYISTNLNFYNKTHSRDMITMSLGDGLSFKYGKFKFDIMGNYNRLWFGSNSIAGDGYFLQSYGASTNASYIINKYVKFSVFFNYYKKDFGIFPERNSNLYSIGISISFNPFSSTFININGGNNYETATLKAYSNETLFASLTINQMISQYFSISGNIFYARSNYLGTDPIVWARRSEHSLIVQGSLNYHITKNFILSLVYKRIQNISNANLFNYTKNYYYASIGFRF